MTISGVLFVDLDGTLVLDNSFHAFLRSNWELGGRGMRMKLLRTTAMRTSTRRDRVDMKRRVLMAFAELDDARRHRVVTDTLRQMSSTLSKPVVDLIQRWQEADEPVVLATAAPDCYASPFADSLGLTDCLATPGMVGPGWVELFGSAKADRCRQWVAENSAGSNRGATISVVTDHLDDLPLLSLAQQATIQASPEMFSVIQRQLPPGIGVEQLDPVSKQPGGGIWLWFDDQASGPHDQWEVRTILSKHRYALMYCGEGTWRRVRPGDALATAVLRLDCPTPPATRTRAAVAMKRSAIRDRLGVYH